MEGLPGENEVRALAFGEAIFYKSEVTIGVGAVEFIAHDGMAQVGEMDAELVFAAGQGAQAHESKGGVRKKFFNGKFRSGRSAVRTNTILNRHLTGFIAAKRGVNDTVWRSDVAVDNGEIFFGHRAACQELTKFTRGDGVAGDDNDSGSFTVKAVNEVRDGGLRFEIKAGAADEAGVLVALGGMTNQPGRLVDDEEIGVLVNDGEQIFQGDRINRRRINEHGFLTAKRTKAF